MYNVQHVDKNASIADYKDVGPGVLAVKSIFYTLQGEGPYVGTPAVFVRLAGCNRGKKVGMGCEFCDTSFELAEAAWMNHEQILQEVDRQGKHWGCGLVVITGGEPMLQNNLYMLVECLLSCDYKVQIESNGDRLAVCFERINILTNAAMLVVSPKVVGGRYHELSSTVMNRADVLKFVTDKRSESPYNMPPPFAGEFAKYNGAHNVFVSPLTVYNEGVGDGETANIFTPGLIDIEKTIDNFHWAAAIAMEQGFRLSLQTHVILGLP